MSANPFTDADPAASTPIMGARAPQEKSKGFITGTKLDTLLKVIRFINIINGCLLGLSCYFAFTVVEGSVTRAFLAVYIGIFAFMLLAFELRISLTESFIKSLFGFMYSYTGRTIFLLFVGAINFGFIENADTSRMGTKIVISMGAFTLANAFFNCFVMCKHPAFQGSGDPSVSGKMTDEQILAYIRTHPELVQAPSSGYHAPSTAAPAEPNPFDSRPQLPVKPIAVRPPAAVGAQAQSPAKASAPSSSGYEPPSLPAKPQPPTDYDGDNPFAL